MKPNPRRRHLDIYPHRIDMQTRFADVDPQRHLNNVRIAELYQEARVAFHRILAEEFQVERSAGSRTLVARQSIDYLAEVEYPGIVTVGIGISRVGGASFSLALALFQNGECVGISDAVLVHESQNGPHRLPEHLRSVLEQQMLPEDAR
ncbi:MAG TPA: thioesterase family protein [Steroidobacteraceae bacterium]|nr:thioesterase family protein [Steroidobacteraceae bacterium]